MNNLSFRGLRMAQPNYVAEFNWPVGKEIPADLRRLTVNEFYHAIQLAARSVREMKEPLPSVGGTQTDYRDRYDQLIQHLNSFLLKNDSTLKEYIDKQIDEVTAEITAIQNLLTNEFQPATRSVEPLVLPEAEPQEEVQPEPLPQKRKAGRPKKVKF